MSVDLPTIGEAGPAWALKVRAALAELDGRYIDPATVTEVEQAASDAAAAQAAAEAAAASVNPGVAGGVATLDGAARLPEAQVPARLEATALNAAYTRADRSAHAPGWGLYFPEAEGAVADGATNDQPALVAALAAAVAADGQVVLQGGAVYGLGATLAIPAGARIVGNHATLRLVSASARVATFQSDTKVSDVTFDGNNLASSYVTEVNASAADLALTDCRWTSTGGTGPVGFRTLDGCSNLLLDRPTFDNLNNCVKLDKNPDTVRIRGGLFTAWEDRALWVLSSAGFATKNLWVEGNLFRPHRVRLAAGVPDMGQVRQPIAVQGVDTDLHRNVHIIDNTVIGAGTSHANTSNPGSADLISVHRTDGLQVIGNTAEYGGDVGITVAQQCKHIVIANNVTRFNDSAGICVGSAGSTSTADGAVVGNVCMNNGQNRANDGPTWALNGINLNLCQRIIVEGNRCGDDQVTKTQKYGITAQATTDVTISGNMLTGNSVSGYHREGTGNTRLTFLAAPVRVVKAADQTVNNSVALVNAADLSVAVQAEGVYQVEAYLIYNSGTTADLSLKWTTPSGAPSDAFDWITDAPASTTTSPNAVIQRTAFTIGSTATIGGTGGNAVATPSGVLTVGATSGNLQLQIAQGTADPTDTILRAGSWLRVTRIG